MHANTTPSPTNIPFARPKLRFGNMGVASAVDTTHRSRGIPLDAIASMMSKPAHPVYKGSPAFGLPAAVGRRPGICALNQAAFRPAPSAARTYGIGSFTGPPVYRSIGPIGGSMARPTLHMSARPKLRRSFSSREAFIGAPKFAHHAKILSPETVLKSSPFSALPHLKPPVVPAFPYKVAKFTHFYCRNTAVKDAIDKLNLSISSNGSDCVFIGDKMKFKGCAYPSSRRKIVFEVYIWTSETSEELIIEFQRRSGDAFEWQTFFTKVKSASGLENSADSAQSDQIRADRATDIEDSLEIDSVENIFTPLLDMLSCTCVNMQLEAASNLARLTDCGRKASRLLMIEGAIQILCPLVSLSVHSDLRRCTMAIFANVASVLSPSSIPAKDLIPVIIASSAILASDQTRVYFEGNLPQKVQEMESSQTKRHAVTVLAKVLRSPHGCYAQVATEYGARDALKHADVSMLGTDCVKLVDLALEL